MATCEYEVMRQQKIAENRRRMEQLGVQQVIIVCRAFPILSSVWRNGTPSHGSHLITVLCTACRELPSTRFTVL